MDTNYIDIIDYAYSPTENNNNYSQRLNLKEKFKKIIYGKRFIKETNDYKSDKIIRLKKN